MTQEQALTILLQASSLAPLPRAQHVQVEEALKLIKSLLEKKDDAE